MKFLIGADEVITMFWGLFCFVCLSASLCWDVQKRARRICIKMPPFFFFYLFPSSHNECLSWNKFAGAGDSAPGHQKWVSAMILYLDDDVSHFKGVAAKLKWSWSLHQTFCPMNIVWSWSAGVARHSCNRKRIKYQFTSLTEGVECTTLSLLSWESMITWSIFSFLW